MGNCFSCFAKEKREHNLVEPEIRIAWSRSGYTDEDIQRMFTNEYSKSSKFY